MKSAGLIPRKKRRGGDRAKAKETDRHFENREIRSYETPYIGGAWHLDFHSASRQVLLPTGEWVTPKICAVIDDHTRLCCHAQWYLGESTEDLVHCFIQALLKRKLPRALMSDNGAAMTSAEFTSGLANLSITHETTLEYAPWQNGKQEFFWTKVEGRLLAMLEGVDDLDLKTLNDATIAWIEQEYNPEVNRETKQSPYARFKASEDVSRPAPTTEDLKLAFCMETNRRQRRSDGTITVEGKRFELPGRYKQLETVTVRYARWDLAHVHMVDKRTGRFITRLYPADKGKNSQSPRRVRDPERVEDDPPKSGKIAPHLEKLMADYSATGLPPAYLTKDEKEDDDATR